MELLCVRTMGEAKQETITMNNSTVLNSKMKFFSV
jgi:hypothetical protein